MSLCRIAVVLSTLSGLGACAPSASNSGRPTFDAVIPITGDLRWQL